MRFGPYLPDNTMAVLRIRFAFQGEAISKGEIYAASDAESDRPQHQKRKCAVVHILEAAHFLIFGSC
jgi:hypothetical protein